MKGNRQGSITRRSDQNRKIKYCFFILRFCPQLVKKVRSDFFDKLREWLRLCRSHSQMEIIL